jgi:prepilin-type N-terminal cleavage/methylation domain-containing protein
MRSQRGFTLVELLVALSVSVLLTTLVYGAIVLSQRSAQAVHDHASRSEQMLIGWQFIDAAIAQAQPVADPNEPDNPTSFAGAQDRLSFVADQPSYLGPGGLIRFRLEARDQGEVDALVLVRQRFTQNRDEPPAEASEATLVDDLEYFRLSYFGNPEDDERASWLAEWNERELLPSLVEIRVKPRGAPAWPVLVARPIAGVETAGLDPVRDEDEDAQEVPDERLDEAPEELFDGEIDEPLDS